MDIFDFTLLIEGIQILIYYFPTTLKFGAIQFHLFL